MKGDRRTWLDSSIDSRTYVDTKNYRHYDLEEVFSSRVLLSSFHVLEGLLGDLYSQIIRSIVSSKSSPRMYHSKENVGISS